MKKESVGEKRHLTQKYILNFNIYTKKIYLMIGVGMEMGMLELELEWAFVDKTLKLIYYIKYIYIFFKSLEWVLGIR